MFEETRTAEEESEEENGEIVISEAEDIESEEEHEGRTKAKHDLKRKATDKPSIGGPAKVELLEEEEEEYEAHNP